MEETKALFFNFTFKIHSFLEFASANLKKLGFYVLVRQEIPKNSQTWRSVKTAMAISSCELLAISLRQCLKSLGSFLLTLAGSKIGTVSFNGSDVEPEIRETSQGTYSSSDVALGSFDPRSESSQPLREPVDSQPFLEFASANSRKGSPARASHGVLTPVVG